jgi:hypothetical protein
VTLDGKAPISQKADGTNNVVVLNLSGGGGSQGGGVSTGGTEGGGGGYIFPIRPEQFQLVEPARQSVTQTIGGAYQDHFGPGVPQITLSGHTGWRKLGGDGDGYEMFTKLRQVHRDYNRMCGEGDPASVTLMLSVNVPQGYGVFRVSSDNFRSLKSVQSPLLFRYEIQFTVLEITAAGGGLTSNTQSAGGANSVPFTADQLVQRSSVPSPLAMADAIGQSLSQLSVALYAVRAGDTYQSVAQDFYGDPTLADAIKSQNNEENLVPGALLRIKQIKI